MTPDQESLCSRRALMISPLLEMHNFQRFHRLVEIVAMNKLYGTAIGVVCLGEESGGRDDREGGPNPRLMGNLPGWFLAAIRG
jgi:hypothetical protein